MATSVPSLSPSSILESSRENRSHVRCTHRSLARLFDEHNQLRCTVCHRKPAFGWLYRCTQDTNGVLPISDFVNENTAVDLADLNLRYQSTKPSALQSTESFLDMSRSNDMDSNMSVSCVEDQDNEMATDELLAQAFHGKRKFDAAFPPEPSHLSTACNLKICPACQPLYRDRAWQSLDHILNNMTTLPPPHDLGNRPVSNAAIVAEIKYARTKPRLDMKAASIFHNSHHGQKDITNTFPFPMPEKPELPLLDQSHSQHVTKRKPCVYRQENSGSDADDEKGFAHMDESETSSANEEPNHNHIDEACSDTDDISSQFDIINGSHSQSTSTECLASSNSENRPPIRHCESIPLQSRDGKHVISEVDLGNKEQLRRLQMD